MISSTELGWVAGFLEGEGTFRFNNRLKNARCGTPTVTAAQKDVQSLNRLHNLLGGNKPSEYHVTRPDGRFRHFQWRVYGGKAIGIMLTLYPLMSDYRKEQIRKAVVTWKQAPGQNKPKIKCVKGHDLTVPGSRTFQGNGGKHGRCFQCLKDWNKRKREQYHKDKHHAS